MSWFVWWTPFAGVLTPRANRPVKEAAGPADQAAAAARQAVTAGLGTAALLATAAVGVLIGFDDLFRQFHLLSFANDFWLLDPRTDHLIQMFPQGFWFDVTLGGGVQSLA